MPRDVQIRGGDGSAPQSYLVPNATEVIPRAVNATLNGAGAASSFLPTVEIVSDGGVVVARIPTDTAVSAGGSAEVSWFPRVRKILGGSSQTYAQAVASLQSTYQLIAQWHLTEGASPYADTSGFAPADPATLTRQVRVTPMTQNLASGPLSTAPTGPSVQFNFDGTAGIGSGDFLRAGDTTPSRYQFAAVAPFTAIAWVKPGAAVNAHDGPVVSTLQVTGFGTPGANDNGWRLNVVAPGNTPKFERAAAVVSPNVYDSVTGGAIPTASWSMLAGVYNGATISLYVNGALVGSAASAGNIVGSASNATVGEGPHYLGDFGTWYYGAASEITIWAGAFTGGDVATLYAAGIG